MSCSDIDECPDACNLRSSSCKNLVGGYECVCNPGYESDGTTGYNSCQDINECKQLNYDCGTDENSECYNIAGSYICKCKRGYQDISDGNTGTECLEVDECTKGNHECHKEATCINSPGSYDCKCNKGFAGTGSYCASDVSFPCPSAECWELDVSTGVCTPLPVETSKCYDLTCTYNSMDVKFKSAMFGAHFVFSMTDDLVLNQQEQEKANSRRDSYIGDLFNTNFPGIAPVYDTATEIWSFSCPLGDCGMTANQITDNDSDLIAFVFDIRKDPTTTDLGHALILAGDVAYKMTFECRYLTAISVNQDVTVHGTDLHSTITHSHSLSDGFKMKIFQDAQFVSPINTNIFIGAMLYVEVTWSLETVTSLVQYYVDYCTVDTANNSIPLVDSNCFSETLHAQLISPDHLNSNQVRFSFKSFTVRSSVLGSKSTIRCGIKLCVLNPMSCQINTDTANCPTTSGDVYKYTPKGLNSD